MPFRFGPQKPLPVAYQSCLLVSVNHGVGVEKEVTSRGVGAKWRFFDLFFGWPLY